MQNKQKNLTNGNGAGNHQNEIQAQDAYRSNGANVKEPKKLILGIFSTKKDVLFLKHGNELIFPSAKNGPAHSQSLISDTMSEKTGTKFLIDKKVGKITHNDRKGYVNAEMYKMKTPSDSVEANPDKFIFVNVKIAAKTGVHENFNLSPLTHAALKKLISDGHL